MTSWDSRMSRKVSHFANGCTKPGPAGGGFSFGSGRRGSYGKIGHGTDAIVRRDPHTREPADDEDDDAIDEHDCLSRDDRGRGGAIQRRRTGKVVVGSADETRSSSLADSLDVTAH
jgi:hypothetical protein